VSISAHDVRQQLAYRLSPVPASSLAGLQREDLRLHYT